MHLAYGFRRGRCLRTAATYSIKREHVRPDLPGDSRLGPPFLAWPPVSHRHRWNRFDRTQLGTTLARRWRTGTQVPRRLTGPIPLNHRLPAQLPDRLLALIEGEYLCKFRGES